jgi:transposase
MKTNVKTKKINLEKALLVGCDMGKSEVTAYFEDEAGSLSLAHNDRFRNTNSSVLSKIEELERIAKLKGYERICILCEPSGGYEKRLMRMARGRGNLAFYVSSEATSAMRVVESNDSEKSDEKDPRIIHFLGKMDKVLEFREMDDSHSILREMNGIYEDESLKASELKNKISSILERLFSDLDTGREFIYGGTGAALASNFMLSPWRILECGYKGFISRMRSSGVKRTNVLARVWSCAKASVNQVMPDWERAMLEERFADLYEDWRRHESRKKNVRMRMMEIGGRLPEFQKFQKEGMGSFPLVRVLAETGNPCDFADSSQILRFAGLNIRRRASGKYKGKDRISKKGRSLLRKTLYQLVFSKMIRKGCLFHDYFEKKKKELPSGLMALVAVMRKALKMLFGVSRSAAKFDRDRVFCSSVSIAA